MTASDQSSEPVVSTSQRTTTLGAIFTYLAEHWREDTALTSSIPTMTAHPAYGAITRIGAVMIPYILEDLRANGGYWFAALRELTGENPVTQNERGNYEAMRAAWLRWGAEHGLLAAA